MTDDTSAPPLDLDAIEARIAACARLCAWEEGDGCREVATQRCAGGNCGLRLCEAHAEEHSNEAAHDTYPLPRSAVPEARALLAEVRRLRGMLDAETAAHRGDLRDDAKALEDLVAQVWRATGETHEPPADVAALLRRVTLRGEQLAHAITETAVVRRALCDAEERESNLRVDVVNARREGAEATRAYDVAAIEAREATARVRWAAEVLRNLPLPGGVP